MERHNILEIKTSQTGAIKQVFERISNIISDCRIVFIAPTDEDEDDYYYEPINNE